MAKDSTGASGNPIFLGSGADDQAADLTSIAAYALFRGGMMRGTTAERTAHSSAGYAGEGDHWFDTSLSTLFVWVSGGWKRRGDRTIGVTSLGQTLAATAFTDLATVTASSTGGRCLAEGFSWAFNGASGADRQVVYRLVCDGVVISPPTAGTQSIPLAGGPRIPATLWGESTPAAGSHVWKLQISASAGSSVYSESSRLKVTEVGV